MTTCGAAGSACFLAIVLTFRLHDVVFTFPIFSICAQSSNARWPCSVYGGGVEGQLRLQVEGDQFGVQAFLAGLRRGGCAGRGGGDAGVRGRGGSGRTGIGRRGGGRTRGGGRARGSGRARGGL